ncbi:putative nucleotidyltransferase [Thermococcus nautili]|uniref:Putative nucleotidyltransferase n=2 Tax=Thermococcus nautili TaxID=195522 RepID=W8NVG9_9EURY|nr:putative nucleotidyltransferase [Thermococcus nautili]
MRLKRKFGDRIASVYLFGSYARGNYGEESDIDLLVVGDIALDDLIDDIFEVLMKHGVVLNVIVEKPEEFERWRDTSFHRTVLSEGVKIY